MGCYLAPDNTLTIERVVEALRSQPKGAELLVAGYLSAKLAAQEGERRAENIAATIATEGIEYHRWELPGNYPVFTVVMVIYHYVERFWRILVTPVFKYNIYDH